MSTVRLGILGRERLLSYGMHTIEMPCVGNQACNACGRSAPTRETSSTSSTPTAERLTFDSNDAVPDFGGTAHGSKGLYQFRVNFSGVYDRLVEGMCRFFEGGPPPVQLRDIVENVAVMEAGNKSLRSGGGWVEVRAIV